MCVGQSVSRREEFGNRSVKTCGGRILAFSGEFVPNRASQRSCLRSVIYQATTRDSVSLQGLKGEQEGTLDLNNVCIVFGFQELVSV